MHVFIFLAFPLAVMYSQNLFCLTLQVLHSRTNPASVPWKGGAVSIFPMKFLHFYSF